MKVDNLPFFVRIDRRGRKLSLEPHPLGGSHSPCSVVETGCELWRAFWTITLPDPVLNFPAVMDATTVQLFSLRRSRIALIIDRDGSEPLLAVEGKKAYWPPCERVEFPRASRRRRGERALVVVEVCDVFIEVSLVRVVVAE